MEGGVSQNNQPTSRTVQHNKRGCCAQKPGSFCKISERKKRKKQTKTKFCPPPSHKKTKLPVSSNFASVKPWKSFSDMILPCLTFSRLCLSHWGPSLLDYFTIVRSISEVMNVKGNGQLKAKWWNWKLISAFQWIIKVTNTKRLFWHYYLLLPSPLVTFYFHWW